MRPSAARGRDAYQILLLGVPLQPFLDEGAARDEVDAGLTAKGLLFDRELDVLGVAVGYGRIGGAARGLASDASVFTGIAQPARDYETVLEATYQVNIAPWWTLQPDLQFVFHPGGHVAAPAPAPPTQPISNALVLGLRSAITF